MSKRCLEKIIVYFFSSHVCCGVLVITGLKMNWIDILVLVKKIQPPQSQLEKLLRQLEQGAFKIWNKIESDFNMMNSVHWSF